MSRHPATLILLVLAVVSSALGVVYVKHENRKQFVQLDGLGSAKDHMDVEWGQLQLEQSTLTTQGRIELIARKRLGMIIPAPDQMVFLKP